MQNDIVKQPPETAEEAQSPESQQTEQEQPLAPEPEQAVPGAVISSQPAGIIISAAIVCLVLICVAIYSGSKSSGL